MGSYYDLIEDASGRLQRGSDINIGICIGISICVGVVVVVSFAAFKYK